MNRKAFQFRIKCLLLIVQFYIKVEKYCLTKSEIFFGGAVEKLFSFFTAPYLNPDMTKRSRIKSETDSCHFTPHILCNDYVWVEPIAQGQTFFLL